MTGVFGVFLLEPVRQQKARVRVIHDQVNHDQVRSPVGDFFGGAFLAFGRGHVESQRFKTQTQLQQKVGIVIDNQSGALLARLGFQDLVLRDQ